MLSQRAASSPAVRTGFAALAALALVAACSQPADNTANSTNDAAADAGQRYEAAPELQGAKLAKGGAMELDGSANPGVAVRLATPGGATQFATADAQGHWRMTLAPSGSPRLFGLSMLAGARVVQAMGYIFVAPDGAVARLRAGGGTEGLPRGAHGLTALALDYDNHRAAALSGLAAPGDTVSLRVDGVERGQAVADRSGRFTLPLNEPLDAGAHGFDLTSASGEQQFAVTIDTPQPLTQGPFVAARQGRAWRIDWRTPGGGEQTTLVLDQAGPGA
jgi:hypothetical protein